MELRQIQYFLKVAELQHMTKAANELHIAQPALSKTIKNLEEDLGTPLFSRVGNRIQLNPAGEIFLEYAKSLESLTTNVHKELDDYMKTEMATITIHKNVSFELLYLAIIEFSHKYPSVNFEMSSLYEMEDTSSSPWDFRLFSTPEAVDEPDCRTVMKEQIQLGVPFSHPLASRSSVTLRELRDENFLFSTPIHSTMNDIMFMHCALNGFKPRRLVSTGTKDDVQYILRNNLGAAFIPELTWYYMTGESRFALVPITDPVCTRCINIGWKTTGYISKAELLFRDFILDYIPGAVLKIRRHYGLPDLP